MESPAPKETPVCDKPAPLLVPADCTLGISFIRLLLDCCCPAPITPAMTVCVRAQGDSDRIFIASCSLHWVNGLSSQKSFPQTVNVDPMARSATQAADGSVAENGFRMI